MKTGDLVRIDGFTCPMYPDDDNPHGWSTKPHIGYAAHDTVCLFLDSQMLRGARELTFARILTPESGVVWVRMTWLKKIV